MKLLGWPGSVWKWIGRYMITVVFVALLAVLLWTLWVYWDGVLSCWEWFACVPDGKESRSTTARNVGLLLFGVVAIAFAVWRGVVASRQAKTSQRGLLNERYQKGAEMIGSDVLTVRLGGIYALQRLAEENAEQYHIQIMRLLCVFVHHPTGDKGRDANNNATGTEGQPENKYYPVREDVHAAMKAIGTRSRVGIKLEQEEVFHLDLSGAHLQGAHLQGAHLIEADLNGANLIGANLIGAHLQGADLQGVELIEADLNSAHLNGAHLNGAILEFAHLIVVRLQDADLNSAHLQGALLIDADLTGANLFGVDLADADLTGANLTTSKLSKAKGLTQQQLDRAVAVSSSPPELGGLRDAKTGDLLEWRGKEPDV